MKYRRAKSPAHLGVFRLNGSSNEKANRCAGLYFFEARYDSAGQLVEYLLYRNDG
jgi:hypothetical protein